MKFPPGNKRIPGAWPGKKKSNDSEAEVNFELTGHCVLSSFPKGGCPLLRFSNQPIVPHQGIVATIEIMVSAKRGAVLVSIERSAKPLFSYNLRRQFLSHLFEVHASVGVRSCRTSSLFLSSLASFYQQPHCQRRALDRLHCKTAAYRTRAKRTWSTAANTARH
jgi:hypothetical protein